MRCGCPGLPSASPVDASRRPASRAKNLSTFPWYGCEKCPSRTSHRPSGIGSKIHLVPRTSPMGSQFCSLNGGIQNGGHGTQGMDGRRSLSEGARGSPNRKMRRFLRPAYRPKTVTPRQVGCCASRAAHRRILVIKGTAAELVCLGRVVAPAEIRGISALAR